MLFENFAQTEHAITFLLCTCVRKEGECNKWNGGTKGACEKSKILDFYSTSNLLYELQWSQAYPNVEVWNIDDCKFLLYMKN
jgi:hypothetical protein